MSILNNKQRNSSHLKETNSNNNNNKNRIKNTNQTKTNNHYNIRNRSTTHEQNPSNEMIISKQMISFLQLTKEKSSINENQPENNNKRNWRYKFSKGKRGDILKRTTSGKISPSHRTGSYKKNSGWSSLFINILSFYKMNKSVPPHI